MDAILIKTGENVQQNSRISELNRNENDAEIFFHQCVDCSLVKSPVAFFFFLPRSSTNFDGLSRKSLHRKRFARWQCAFDSNWACQVSPAPKGYGEDVNLWSGWLQCVGVGMLWGGNHRWVSHMLWQHTQHGNHSQLSHPFICGEAHG